MNHHIKKLLSFFSRVSLPKSTNFVLTGALKEGDLNERQKSAMAQIAKGSLNRADVDDVKFTQTTGGQYVVSVIVDGVVFEKQI